MVDRDIANAIAIAMIAKVIEVTVILFITFFSFIGESIWVSLSIARTLAESLHPLTILSVRGRCYNSHAIPYSHLVSRRGLAMEAAPDGVTQLLINWRNGDKAALDQLTPLVYEELRRLARGFMRKERSNHTLQTSALINEAYLKLADQDETNWQNRAHFFAVAAQIMRHILVDHARSYGYEKRGAGAQRVGLDDAKVFSEERAGELVALDEALRDHATGDPRKSRLVELRFFGGLNIDETAEVMELSPTTVQREWRAAKAWLQRFMKGENPAENL